MFASRVVLQANSLDFVQALCPKAFLNANNHPHLTQTDLCHAQLCSIRTHAFWFSLRAFGSRLAFQPRTGWLAYQVPSELQDFPCCCSFPWNKNDVVCRWHLWEGLRAAISGFCSTVRSFSTVACVNICFIFLIIEQLQLKNYLLLVFHSIHRK